MATTTKVPSPIREDGTLKTAEEMKQQTITNNTMVKATKQTITDEEGKVVKELYYIHIATEKGVVSINTGEKNYNKVKEITI